MRHHRNTVGERERLGLVVRDEQGRDPDPLLDALELDLHVGPKVLVDCGKWLVQQDHARLDDQRARKRHALLLSARKLAGRARTHLGQPDHFQCLGHSRADFAGRHLVHLQAEGDVLSDGHVREKCVTLEHHADRTPVGRDMGHSLPIDEDLPPFRLEEARDEVEQGRLATARRTQQRQEFALADLERNTVDRRGTAK